MKNKSKGTIRLNRYIAMCGVCSRRNADKLILEGKIKLNDVVVTKLGAQVSAGDAVEMDGKKLEIKKYFYFLLNKPKDVISTVKDERGRCAVVDLIDASVRHLVFPIGRLDRNTTGLIILTNDGMLTEALAHPRNETPKLYQVVLDKSLKIGDLNKIRYGIELEDGHIKPDQIQFTNESQRNELGILLHSGRNRIVRRLFEALGYKVVKLDRTAYANLTKKNLPRGKYRPLSEREIIGIKQYAKSKSKV